MRLLYFVLDLLDHVCRIFLGFRKNEPSIKPEAIMVKKNKIIIQAIESYRHSPITFPIEHYDFNNTSEADKKKLGHAIGKGLAKNLTISFAPKANSPNE